VSEEEQMDYPEELRYTKEHEWVATEEGDRARVGITDFAQDALGDVVYVDVPEEGTEVRAGEAFGEVESTKSVSDIFSPVSGRVVERNLTLEDQPELVNEDPYGDGWMVVVEMSDSSELGELLDAAAYRAFAEGAGEGEEG
jgi:glycine cleavage system H protein